MPYTPAQIRAIFAKHPEAKARRIVHEGGHRRRYRRRRVRPKRG